MPLRDKTQHDGYNSLSPLDTRGGAAIEATGQPMRRLVAGAGARPLCPAACAGQHFCRRGEDGSARQGPPAGAHHCRRTHSSGGHQRQHTLQLHARRPLCRASGAAVGRLSGGRPVYTLQPRRAGGRPTRPVGELGAGLDGGDERVWRSAHTAFSRHDDRGCPAVGPLPRTSAVDATLGGYDA